MASSATKLVAIVIAISDKLFKLWPAAYVTWKVPTSDTGTATAGSDDPSTVICPTLLNDDHCCATMVDAASAICPWVNASGVGDKIMIGASDGLTFR